jgi:hypothetical protein
MIHSVQGADPPTSCPPSLGNSEQLVVPLRGRLTKELVALSVSIQWHIVIIDRLTNHIIASFHSHFKESHVVRCGLFHNLLFVGISTVVRDGVRNQALVGTTVRPHGTNGCFFDGVITDHNKNKQ